MTLVTTHGGITRGAMNGTYPELACQNRNSELGIHSLRISFPSVFNKPANPLVTGEDIAAANIVCPQCHHAYHYTRDAVRWTAYQQSAEQRSTYRQMSRKDP
jgi:hypothetical protein